MLSIDTFRLLSRDYFELASYPLDPFDALESILSLLIEMSYKILTISKKNTLKYLANYF